MPAGTNYRIETATTLSALVTAVDAVITADSTWEVRGTPSFCKDEQVWVQPMVKGGALVVGADGKIYFGASDNYVKHNDSTDKLEFWVNGTKELEVP